MTDAARAAIRWHRPTGADWRAVQLAWAEGCTLYDLQRTFGIGRDTLRQRRDGEGWTRPMAPDARAALEREVELGRLDAAAPAMRGGARRSRWGRDGADWLAMELDYVLGRPVNAIAAANGYTPGYVRARASMDGWRRDADAARIAEMTRQVQTAAFAADLRAGQVNAARERLQVLASLARGLVGAGKADRRSAANTGFADTRHHGRQDQTTDERRTEPDTGFDYLAELRRQLGRVVDRIKRRAQLQPAAELGDDAGDGEGRA